MNLQDRGIAPVMGVMILVAITVVLVAVVGGFALGMTDSLGSSKVAKIDVQNSGNDITIKHRHGDVIDLEGKGIVLSEGNIDVRGDLDTIEEHPKVESVSVSDSDFGAGDTIQIDLTEKSYAESISFVSDETTYVSETDETVCSQNVRSDLIVGKSGCRDYTSITNALESAPSGSVIFVKDGQYEESVQIETDDIHLITQSATLKGNSSSTENQVTFSNADSSRLVGFDIVDTPDDGIHIYESNNIVVRDVDISNTGDEGIEITRGSKNTLRGFTVDGGAGDGIHIDDSPLTTVDNGRVVNYSDDGIQINSGSQSVAVTELTIKNVGDNGGYINSKDGEYQDIRIVGSTDYGIYFDQSSSDILMTDSEIRESGSDGIKTSSDSDHSSTTITESRFVGNGIGINHLGSGELNATYNWWGSDNGPSGTKSDNVSGDVKYTPYKDSGDI